MKNSNDTIGNRTRDLPTCSAVPQSHVNYFMIKTYRLAKQRGSYTPNPTRENYGSRLEGLCGKLTKLRKERGRDN